MTKGVNAMSSSVDRRLYTRGALLAIAIVFAGFAKT